MGAYIKGMGVISAQRTFESEIFTEGVLPFFGNRLTCVEPAYTDLIDAKHLRRMSRLLKMGTAAALQSLKNANVQHPDAIIVGTTYGCQADTISFLQKLVQNKEEMLNPTPFIYSTHNTVASQIALLLDCKGYNSTYVHRNISLENALIDGLLLMKEGAANTVLVGGLDELLDVGFFVLDRLKHFKNNEEVNSENLYALSSPGSVGSEGASFFTLCNEYEENCLAKIHSVRTFSFQPVADVIAAIKKQLAECGIVTPDVFISGYNGDTDEKPLFEEVSKALKVEDRTLLYKHLSGEYPTSVGFAIWMASMILKQGKIPEIFSGTSNDATIKNVLIYHQSKAKHHSFMLLSAC